MTLILSGTDGLSDVDGSAATPAIRGTDTNTGIFFPAADTIAFAEGGAEIARFDSSGNFGLGVTPSAWNGIYKVIQTDVGSIYSSSSYNNVAVGANVFYNASNSPRYIRSDFATLYGQDDGAHVWYNAASGTAGNAITFTQAMTLDASGNLGVGTTSPAARVDARNVYTSGGGVIRLGTTGDGIPVDGAIGSVDFFNSDSDANKVAAQVAGKVGGLYGGGGYLTFSTSAYGGSSTERARIDESGNLLVNETTNYGQLAVTYTGANAGFGVGTFRRSASDGYACAFLRGTTEVGKITVNASSTTYATSSDYRLKENILPMTGALATVAQLKPVTYTWKTNGSSGQGFIAHELQEVVSDCVVGSKDAVDADGNPVYQGIDTSFLVATLTAAIQEQQALIESLKARLDAANL